MGVWQNDRVEIIANDQGNRTSCTTPSYVSDNERLIGPAAKSPTIRSNFLRSSSCPLRLSVLTLAQPTRECLPHSLYVFHCPDT